MKFDLNGFRPGLYSSSDFRSHIPLLLDFIAIRTSELFLYPSNLVYNSKFKICFFFPKIQFFSLQKSLFLFFCPEFFSLLFRHQRIYDCTLSSRDIAMGGFCDGRAGGIGYLYLYLCLYFQL